MDYHIHGNISGSQDNVGLRCKYPEKVIFHVLPIFPDVLQAERLTPFVLYYLFKDIYRANSLGR